MKILMLQIRILLLIFLIAPSIGKAEFPIAKVADVVLSNDPLPLFDTPPDPTDLKPVWWRYFDVDSEELLKRIGLTSDYLNSLAESTPDQTKATIQQIKERLGQYRQIRGKKFSEPLAPEHQQETYTLQQWLDIVHKQQNLQAELDSEQDELKSAEKSLAVTKQNQDTQFAAYLNLPTNSPEKTYQGINVMAVWLEFALNTEKHRLKKDQFTAKQDQLAQINLESAVAQQRISFSELDVQHKEQEIKKLAAELASIRKRLPPLFAAIENAKQDSELDKARLMLTKQRVTLASIQEAIAEASLLRANMEKALLQTLASEDSTTLAQIWSERQIQQQKLTELKERLDNWRDKTESEQDRAGKTLSNLLTAPIGSNPEVTNTIQQRLTEIQNCLFALQQLDSEIFDAGLIGDWQTALYAKKTGMLLTVWTGIKTTIATTAQLIWEHLQTSLFTMGETPVTPLGLMRLGLILTLAWTLSHFVREGLRHFMQQNNEISNSSTYLYTIGRVAHYLFLLIGISIGLSSIGIDLSNFALIAGALSVGIGFGLQAIINNFVSGLIVLFERSLRIGDFVELSSGLAGEVKAINVRSTLVTTTDMVDILVPNSEFVSGHVINWTLTDATRRIHIPFGVAYGSDKELVRKAGLEAANNTPYTLKNHRNRQPEVWLINFGSSSLEFELVVWVLPYAVKNHPW